MEPGHTSIELLAHFDLPTDVDWVAGVERSDPPALLGAPFGRPQSPKATRGVGWVLQWTAALAVFAVAAVVLAEFIYRGAAEHSLAIAARAGTVEATLPRATHRSITAAVERRLASYPRLANQLQLSLLQNGLPTGQQIRPADGDRLSITLAAPTSAVVPGWLRTFTFWRSETRVQAHAERKMPARKLRPANS